MDKIARGRDGEAMPCKAAYGRDSEVALGESACSRDGEAMLDEVARDRDGKAVPGVAACQDPFDDLAWFLEKRHHLKQWFLEKPPKTML